MGWSESGWSQGQKCCPERERWTEVPLFSLETEDGRNGGKMLGRVGRINSKYLSQWLCHSLYFLTSFILCFSRKFLLCFLFILLSLFPLFSVSCVFSSFCCLTVQAAIYSQRNPNVWPRLRLNAVSKQLSNLEENQEDGGRSRKKILMEINQAENHD